MKQTFTLLTLCAFLSTPSLSFGQIGNGFASTYNNIKIDGDMADWAPILNDADNNTYDSNNPDLDVVPDNGRDIVRSAIGQNSAGLLVYLERAGSATNSASFLIYVDINKDGRMNYYEPVMVITWSGSNRRASLEINKYEPSNTALGDLLMGDGFDMPGKVVYVGLGGSNIGMGSIDGKSLEIPISFSFLHTIGKTDNLSYGTPFNFQISSINGNTQNIGGQNDVINDNMGGSFKGFINEISLPIKLLSFQGALKNGKAQLQWSVADNETGDYFEIEKSEDGKSFRTIGISMVSAKTSLDVYAFNESAELVNTAYYRLKIINKDLSVTQSKIVMLRNQKEVKNNSLVILQNTVDATLMFQYTAAKANKSMVNIYNMGGAKMLTTSVTVQAGFNSVSINLDGKFNSGTYILEVIDGTEKSTAKLIKN